MCSYSNNVWRLGVDLSVNDPPPNSPRRSRFSKKSSPMLCYTKLPKDNRLVARPLSSALRAQQERKGLIDPAVGCTLHRTTTHLPSAQPPGPGLATVSPRLPNSTVSTECPTAVVSGCSHRPMQAAGSPVSTALRPRFALHIGCAAQRLGCRWLTSLVATGAAPAHSRGRREPLCLSRRAA